MNLIEIDVIRTKTTQARVNLSHDRFARQAACICSFAHGKENLGGDDHLITLGVIAERTPHDLFAGTVRVAVRSVEKIDAEFERLLDEGAAHFFIERPGVGATIGHAISHAAQAKSRHLETGMSKSDVIHVYSPASLA